VRVSRRKGRRGRDDEWRLTNISGSGGRNIVGEVSILGKGSGIELELLVVFRGGSSSARVKILKF
jgi:hypothetical protein